MTLQEVWEVGGEKGISQPLDINTIKSSLLQQHDWLVLDPLVNSFPCFCPEEQLKEFSDVYLDQSFQSSDPQEVQNIFTFFGKSCKYAVELIWLCIKNDNILHVSDASWGHDARQTRCIYPLHPFPSFRCCVKLRTVCSSPQLILSHFHCTAYSIVCTHSKLPPTNHIIISM